MPGRDRLHILWLSEKHGFKKANIQIFCDQRPIASDILLNGPEPPPRIFDQAKQLTTLLLIALA